MPRVAGDFAAAAEIGRRRREDLSLARLSRRAASASCSRPATIRAQHALNGLTADVALGEGCEAFWGASALADGTVETGGGRVLTVTALGDDSRKRVPAPTRPSTPCPPASIPKT